MNKQLKDALLNAVIVECYYAAIADGREALDAKLEALGDVGMSDSTVKALRSAADGVDGDADEDGE